MGRIDKAAMNEADCPTEEVEQVCLMRWAMMQGGELKKARMLYAIPNGGHRNKAVAAKLKAQGVRAGVPDLCLPVSRGGKHGLYIELKRRKGGRVSPEQLEWMECLMQEGYHCAVCKGWDAAAKVIEEYLLEKE